MQLEYLSIFCDHVIVFEGINLGVSIEPPCSLIFISQLKSILNRNVLFFLLLILLLFVLKIIHLLPYNEALGPSIFPDLVKLKIRFHFVSLGLLRIWLALLISFVFFIEFSVLSVETLVKVVQKGYYYEKTDERNECNQHFDDIVNSFSTLLLLIHIHTDIAQQSENCKEYVLIVSKINSSFKHHKNDGNSC